MRFGERKCGFPQLALRASKQGLNQRTRVGVAAVSHLPLVQSLPPAASGVVSRLLGQQLEAGGDNVVDRHIERVAPARRPALARRQPTDRCGQPLPDRLLRLG